MSLLGYLVPRIAASGAEPAATQALAYLLNASTGVAEAFVGVVGPTGIEAFTLGRITAEEQHGDHFPDLTIRDTDGVVRILVENKFWAGLTSAQPVSYLEALPDDASSLLVFIVPHQRMYGLWGELREKCRRSNVELAGESKGRNITWARAGERRLAITSWKHVLRRLGEAAAEPSLRQDIAQLRGLTDRMNSRRVPAAARGRGHRLKRHAPADQLHRADRRDRRPPRDGWHRRHEEIGLFVWLHLCRSLPARPFEVGTLAGGPPPLVARSGHHADLDGAQRQRTLFRLSRAESGRLRSCSTMRVQSKTSCTFRFASRRGPIETV